MNFRRPSRRTRSHHPDADRDPDVLDRIRSNDVYLRELKIREEHLRDAESSLLLADALVTNTHLQRVNFQKRSYDGIDLHTFRKIVAALSKTNVQKIAFGHSRLRIFQHKTDRTYAIHDGNRIVPLNPLKRLDLNSCNIGPLGAMFLSTIISTNHTLTDLRLTENDIGDDGAGALAYAIKHDNRTLKELTLDNNGISERGQRALRDAVFDDSSYLAMERDTNHILESYFYNPRNVFGKCVMNEILLSHAANLRSKCEKGAIAKKLRRVLQKKYGVRLHFDSFAEGAVDTEIMPHILGWIAQRCDLETMYGFKPILLHLMEGRGGYDRVALL
mmetsp:Transcript_26584/g.56165  ORF Transcript_26584/g.56165 Transcript_26584/m.56165 type:complete len:331 (-) Transcript_26584:380-1372(-)